MITQIEEPRTPALELTGVSFSYNGENILEEVNLSIPAGDFLAVVGPNGGGKTTLLKIVLGLLPPRRGRVRVLGLPPREARTRVGYLAQRSELDPGFPINVEGVVLMGRLGPGRMWGPWKREDKEAAARALGQVDLADLARRPFRELSGGQKQRALIARALVMEPEILLLDEPTSNVDPRVEVEVYELLAQLNQRMTVVTVTHDLGFVSPYIKEVACVNRRVVLHPTSDVTGEVISEIYGRDVRMVRHDTHSHAGGGNCCHV